MSKVIATLPLSRGNIEIIEFPVKAEFFTDFPDGRFVVTGEQGRQVGSSFIRVNGQPLMLARTAIAEQRYMEARVEILRWAKEQYGADVGIISKSLDRALGSTMFPSKAQAANTMPYVITGDLDGGQGSGISMRLPRGLRFRAIRPKHGDPALSREGSPQESSYSGKLQFAGEEWRFTLQHFNIFDWCDPVLLQPQERLDERIESAARYLPDYMSVEHAQMDLRRYLIGAFPWADRLGLIGEVKIETATRYLKNAVRIS